MLASPRVEAAMEDESRSDEELIAAVNGFDEAAFEALYYRYRDWVVQLARRFTGDPELALDVLQETFLYFVKKFPGFRLTCKLKTFLYPVVRNCSITAAQKARRFQGDEAALRSMEAEPAREITGSDGLAAVLATLPAEQRETLWLRFVDGLSLDEIAQAMEVPPGTVKSRLHNALGKLREDPRTRDLLGLES